MNLLAHALLSGDEPGMIAGGVLADWLKGPVEELPRSLADGVRRHRKIDVFTDAHPVTAVSRRRLQERWGRYSGILVDLAYDVCLVAAWNRFCGDSLEDFVSETYAALDLVLADVPYPARDVARHMIAEDWLTAYGRWDGVASALRRITRRLSRSVDLVGAAPYLKELEPELQKDFDRFFPDLAATCP